jgi:uncharacterized repeat protein (TIGR01451 family)
MKLSKKIKVWAITLVTAALALAASTSAVSGPVPPGGVRIDSTLGVLNRTQNQSRYINSVNARVDDVINVQVWYHNTEEANSGKVAENVNVRVALPGTRQTAHRITSTVQGTNTNYDTETATVGTSIPTNIQFIPGSAIRRYNAGSNASPRWVTQAIPDSIVNGGYTLSRVQPCWNFQETITLQVRVMSPAISIVKQVKVEGASTWVTNTQVQGGDTLAYLITVKNEGNTQLSNVIVRDSLPPRMQYVPGSAILYNANHRNGISISDSLINGGVNTGNYTPGSDVKIRFQARVPSDAASCSLTYTNVAVTRADSVGEFYNTAIAASICRPLATRIRVIKFNDRNGSRTQESGEPQLAGWHFRVTGPGTDEEIITDETGVALLTAINPGRYTITEINQDGWENTTGLTIVRDVNFDPATQTFIFGNRRVGGETFTPGGGDTLPVSGPEDAALPIAGAMSMSGGLIAWIRSKKQLLAALKK